MAWGDTFKSAWNAATDTGRNAVGALATGAENAAGWTKNRVSQGVDIAKQAATWTANKTVEVKQWTKDTYDFGEKKFEQGKNWAKDKATTISKAVKKTYQNVDKKFTDTVAGAAIVICKYGKKGFDRAKAERNKPAKDKDVLTKVFDYVKPSIEQKWSKSYRRKGSIGDIEKANNKLKNEGISFGVSLDWLKNKNGEAVEDRWLYYGDESINLQVGTYDASVKSGVSYNTTKREWKADIVDATAHAALLSVQGKKTLGEADLFELKGKGELASVEAKGKIGATLGKDKKEIVAEGELSVDAIKITVSGDTNLTPKSIWDNTAGRLPFLGKAPAWLDHGIKVGAEGEAGVGAGIGGVAGYKDGKFVLGGKLGWGPKVGVKLGIGFK